jgi:hypothetical protein
MEGDVSAIFPAAIEAALPFAAATAGAEVSDNSSD